MEIKIKCFECGYEIDKDSALEYEGELYCDDCVRVCGDCGENYLRDELTEVDTGDYVCENCLDENYFYCDHCEEYHSNDYTSYYVDSIDGYVCENVIGDYPSCYECGYRGYYENMSYHEENGEHYCNDCVPEEGNTFHYHSGQGRGLRSDNYRYRIGIELEREDSDFKKDLNPHDFLDDTGWAVEYDSSLDSYSGFEAVSPIYALRLTELERLFKKGTELHRLANAGFSCSCGGHITISDTKRKPDDIIDDIAGYLPILYALFPKRAYSHWCQAQSKDNYKMGGRSALNKRGNYEGDGLEIRLFDAPIDEKDIINRARLLKYMLQHKAPTIELGVKELSDSSKLREIVRKHLNRFNMDYKVFYKDIARFSRDIDRQRLGIRKVNNILEK